MGKYIPTCIYLIKEYYQNQWEEYCCFLRMKWLALKKDKTFNFSGLKWRCRHFYFYKYYLIEINFKNTEILKELILKITFYKLVTVALV